MGTSIAHTTYVGLDGHQDSISVALIRPNAAQPDEDQIPNTPEAVRKLVRRWKDPAAVRVCYEAGPTGYGLQRTFATLGIDCLVIAPALIPKRAEQRVKTVGPRSRRRCVDGRLLLFGADLGPSGASSRKEAFWLPCASWRSLMRRR